MRGGLIIAGVWAALLTPAGAWAQGDPGNPIDARIQASADAAEALQGPLDGAWRLKGADGRSLYEFQLVDKAGGADPLEGVWRDLTRPIAPGDIGLIDTLQRGPGALTITFAARPGAPPVVVSLRSGPNGAWSGQLRDGGAAAQVSMVRR